MKKLISSVILFSLSLHLSLFAETAPLPNAATTESASTTQIEKSTSKTNQSTNVVQGSAAARSTNTGRNTSWQNWAFAGSALAIAAVGVIVVALNSGENNPTSH